MAIITIFNQASRLIQKFDLGVLFLRASLLLPVLLYARVATSEEQFSDFSLLFHSALLLSTVVVFGIHEQLLVDRRSLLNTIDGLTLRLCLVGFSLTIWAYFSTEFSLAFVAGVIAFVMIYRGYGLLFLSWYARSSKSYGYVLLTLCLMALMLVFGVAYSVALWVVMGIFCFYTLFRRQQIELSSIIRQQALGWPYTVNQLMTSFFVQGSLVVYALCSNDHQMSTATHFVYFANISFIVQGVLYRLLVRECASGKAILPSRLRTSLLLASCFSIAYMVLGEFLESLLFSAHRLSQSDFIALAFLVLTQSVNASLSGFLVGSGKIKNQAWVSLLGVVLITLGCIVNLASGEEMPLSYTLLFASVVLLLVRSYFFWDYFNTKAMSFKGLK